ncbi:hypothetical protein VTN49DRAFT_259 [Thermomyces lanuginosus]|uniref:uncharacterized protein n=1 Tax=Thermomyces lanuginosus TaxID=5541 RepID=UPI0037435343
MSSSNGVEITGIRSRKRPRTDMSNSSFRRSPGARYGEPSSSSSAAQRSGRPRNLPGGRQQRFEGDGFDFRRPVMSNNSPRREEVIDLTNEPDSPPQQSRGQQPSLPGRGRRAHRPPRFGRNIMADVVDLVEDNNDNEVEEVRPEAPDSPEVQFMGATVRPQPAASRRSMSPSTLLQFLREPFFSEDFMTREVFRDEIGLRARHVISLPRMNYGDWLSEPEPGPNLDLTVEVPFFDYRNLTTINDTVPLPRGNTTLRTSYKPPTPPPEGFTRTVRPDDVVVCPNCDHELGSGEGEEQQIWVAKPCGHVYCGQCARNRSKTKRTASAAAKTKPFSKCKVEGCEKSVSAPKAMFQIFL